MIRTGQVAHIFLAVMYVGESFPPCVDSTGKKVLGSVPRQAAFVRHPDAASDVSDSNLFVPVRAGLRGGHTAAVVPILA